MRSIILALVLVGPALAGDVAWDPPADWMKKEVEGLKDPAFLGPVSDMFAANMNFVRDEAKGKLDPYVDSNLKKLKATFPKLLIVSRQPFKSTSGLAGVRLATVNNVNGKLLIQVFYVFEDGDKKFIFTASQSAKGDDMIETFDKAMKTVRLEK